MNCETVELPSEVRLRLLGRIPQERIRSTVIPRHSAELIVKLMGITDVSAGVADALDQLGRGSVIPRSKLMPLDEKRTVVGPAITLRYVPVDGDASSNRDRGTGEMLGDRDLYGLAKHGDVAVFDASAVRPNAVVGGLSVAWANKAELSACITDGFIRDSTSIAAEGLPVWSGGRSPRAGRYRVETAEINGVVSLAGEIVRPGDYIVADADGVCVVPHGLFPAVVDTCIVRETAEEQFLDTIRRAESVEKLVARSKSSTPV